jgi:alpha-L-fucosidase
MLDFTPDRTGLIPASYAARYKEFGDWIKSCYKRPVENQSVHGDGKSFLIKYQVPSAVDRIVVEEDQTEGQKVRKYLVEGIVNGSQQWIQLSNGTSVGNKKIDLFDPVTLNQIRLTIVNSVGIPKLRFFGGFIC